MYLDEPEILAAALPHFVTAAPRAWRSAAPDGFVADLLRAMGAARVLSGPDSGDSKREVSPFWSDLVLLADSPRSQYDALRETLARVGPPPASLACVALIGGGFHGQHGRHWTTAPGNLHLSAIVPCDLPASTYATAMPAWPAVAVVEAIAALSGGRLSPGIKWVNDILLDGRKFAGVLTALQTHRGRVRAVVLGVGLNVGVTPEQARAPGGVPPTSLQAEWLGRSPGLGSVLETVLATVAARWTRLQERGPEELLTAYRRHSAVLGRQVSIGPESPESGARPIRGEVVAIAADLSLRLRGHAAPITSGRLTILPDGT